MAKLHNSLLDDGLHRLSRRKYQTLTGLLSGLGEKQIAERLNISRNTVHIYVKQLYVDFQVNSRSELLAIWIRGNLGIGNTAVTQQVATPLDLLEDLRAERCRLVGTLATLDQEIARRQHELAQLKSFVTSSGDSPDAPEDLGHRTRM
jgi:DNA-binding CsgD family transcriptional regulator